MKKDEGWGWFYTAQMVVSSSVIIVSDVYPEGITQYISICQPMPLLEHRNLSSAVIEKANEKYSIVMNVINTNELDYSLHQLFPPEMLLEEKLNSLAKHTLSNQSTNYTKVQLTEP